MENATKNSRPVSSHLRRQGSANIFAGISTRVLDNFLSQTKQILELNSPDVYARKLSIEIVPDSNLNLFDSKRFQKRWFKKKLFKDEDKVKGLLSKSEFQSISSSSSAFKFEDADCDDRREDNVQLSLLALPDDIIFYIIRFLPRDASFVALKSSCSHLHKLMAHRSVWKLDTLAIKERLVPSLIRVLFTMKPCLSTLDVSGCLSVNNEFLHSLSLHFPSIKNVDISGCVRVSNKGLAVLSHNLTAIRILKLSGLRMITVEGVLKLMEKHVNSLKDLNISYCFGMKEDAFKLAHLVNFCTMLESLSVRWERELGVLPMWEFRLSEILASASNLHHLDMSDMPGRNAGMVVKALCHMPRGHLTHLHMARSFLRDEDIMSLCSKVCNLKYLDISDSPDITDVAVEAISKTNRRLLVLCVSGCYRITDLGVRILLTNLYELRELYVRDCYTISSYSLNDTLALRPSLRFLDASGTLISHETLNQLQKARDNLGFLMLAEHCPMLGLSKDSLRMSKCLPEMWKLRARPDHWGDQLEFALKDGKVVQGRTRQGQSNLNVIP